MRHFRVCPCPGEAGLTLGGPPESVGLETIAETARTKPVGCIINGSPEPKMEIPV
jgi:hypothetical protein